MEAWVLIEFITFLLVVGFALVSHVVTIGVLAISRALIRWVKPLRR